MSDFVTVFEISRFSNGLLQQSLFRFAIGLVALSIGLLGLFRRRNAAASPKSSLSAILLIIWALIWLTLHIPFMLLGTAGTESLVDIYRNGKSDVVEGIVSVSHTQPYHGHAKGDIISVGGKEFEINYFLVTPGYNKTIAHGGALNGGVYARLHYSGGTLLKVEIRAVPIH